MLELLSFAAVETVEMGARNRGDLGVRKETGIIRFLRDNRVHGGRPHVGLSQGTPRGVGLLLRLVLVGKPGRITRA